MRGVTPAREELLAYVDAYRHHHETHRRTAAGTHARSTAAGRMKELDTTFERLLRAWGVDERVRQAWRSALHHGTTPPLVPDPLPRLLFLGRSEAGSEARAIKARDGAIDVYVDGNMVRRLRGLSLRSSDGRTWFELDNRFSFEEAFEAPPEAVDALRAWVTDPSGEPPLGYATALAADGLTDRNFALTQRGRRAVGARELAPA